MIRKPLASLLPEYANNTLGPVKRRIVAWWLKRDAAARAELHALQHLHDAMQAQPVMVPAPDGLRTLQTRIRAQATSGLANARPTTRPGHGFWRAWAGGMALVVLSLILLWNVLPPGVVLQWSAQGGEPITFRVYRAASNEPGDFELVREISAREDSAEPDARVYTFRDFLLLPGQEYLYRVEVIGQNGLTSTSQTIISDAMEALPGQLAVLLSLIIIAYGLTLPVQKSKMLPLQLV
jgi:hypothetical protein